MGERVGECCVGGEGRVVDMMKEIEYGSMKEGREGETRLKVTWRDKNILTSLPCDSVWRIELPQQNKCPNHRLKTNLSTVKITISFPPWIHVYSGTFYSVLVIQTTHTRLGSLLPFTHTHTYIHTYIHTHTYTYMHIHAYVHTTYIHTQYIHAYTHKQIHTYA